MYLPRIISKKIKSTLRDKSILLLGPRQTGKRSLIREELQPDTFTDCQPNRVKLQFWRSHTKHEVDYILNENVAIEVKHTSQVSKDDLKGLKAISEEQTWKRKIVVSRDQVPRKVGDVEILPVQIFLEMLWNGDVG